jgi:general transcription factor 3C protein 4
LDALVLTLTDGSFHVVQNLSIEPDVAESSSSIANGENFRGWLTSDVLSHTARMTFHSAEKGNVDQNDTCKIHGVVSYDADATFLWAYE